MLLSCGLLRRSDHGYNQGQFRQLTGKNQPYEHDLRIPMFIRGPGIRPGSVLPEAFGTNVDVAPTILALAGVAAPSSMDGRSVAAFLLGTAEAARPWRRAVLTEYYPFGHSPPWQRGGVHMETGRNNSYIGLRVLDRSSGGLGNLLYVEYSDVITDWGFERPYFLELYDIDADPFQLRNLAVANQTAAGEARLQMLHKWLREQWACQGAACD